MVSAALQKLGGCGATLIEEGNAIHASLERFKTTSERCPSRTTKFTTWGDVDHMLQRTNHYTKDRSRNIDWSLEVEER
jgi:hypothetical protein